MKDEVYVPYGAYWCTPFARWQGSLSHLHSVKFAAHVSKQALEQKNISADHFDYGVLGLTVPQQFSFYGLPWATGLMGASHIGGPTISQACATSARVVTAASDEILAGRAECVLTMTTDRTSNGPNIYYPDPLAPGGTGKTENWVLDNFSSDPLAKCDMTSTAENCASKWGVSLEQQHEVVLRRYQQYLEATEEKDGETFQQRYMTLPLDLPNATFRKTIGQISGDEGITQTTAEGLAKLRPVKDDGTVTYAAQTHPADGCAGMVFSGKDKAKELSANDAITIRVVAVAQHRTDLAFMPEAPIQAAAKALDMSCIKIQDLTAIKSHNPFALNDIIFASETGADLDSMNNYGCSLIWGHPQGPTGMRCMIELIEELAIRGGGYGLFHGCAAGDSAMAVVFKVG